ncbi:hypothetical protein SUGI_0635460 [Cryptomeria japonica]|nr:hypothetical protein SUGI_0635460 [Cryptomeria japonica]
MDILCVSVKVFFMDFECKTFFSSSSGVNKSNLIRFGALKQESGVAGNIIMTVRTIVVFQLLRLCQAEKRLEVGDNDRKRVVLLMLLDSVTFANIKTALSLDSGITTIWVRVR